MVGATFRQTGVATPIADYSSAEPGTLLKPQDAEIMNGKRAATPSVAALFVSISAPDRKSAEPYFFTVAATSAAKSVTSFSMPSPSAKRR